jgi:hypothetical protein
MSIKIVQLHKRVHTDIPACALQEPGMLEHLAEHLPEEHRNMQSLLAVATSSQVLT